MMGGSPLNPGQRAAVEAPLGGTFISAGAGTGKTRVLTERFVRLALEGPDASANIERLMAITFTDKAAASLTHRIRSALVAEGCVEEARLIHRAWIGTIHGMCARFLRRHALDAGLDPRFAVLADTAQGALKAEALEAAILGSEGAHTLLAELGSECLLHWVPRIATMRGSTDRAIAPLEFAAVDTGVVLAGAADELRSLIVELAREPLTATVEANLEALNVLLATLDGRSDEGGDALLEATARFRQVRRGSATVKELAERAKACACAIAEAAADDLVRDMGERFRAIEDDYASRYAELKRQRGALDFDDLQAKTLELLRARPDIAAASREARLEVMVDEFQDTDPLQMAVIGELAGEAVLTVGDERQSIYGFRGADVEVFRGRAADLPRERRHPLTENYRSHPELLAFFNSLFTRPPFWPSDFQLLEPGAREGLRDPDGWPGEAPRVEVLLMDRRRCEGPGKRTHEAAALAARLAEMVGAGTARPRDIAVLLRSATGAAVFEAAIRDAGLPVISSAGGGFFDSAEVDELEALVRVLWDVTDDMALVRVLAGRMCALSEDSLFLLSEHARALRDAEPSATVPLWDAARDPGRPGLRELEEVALRECLGAIESARAQQGRKPLSGILLDVCETVGYDLALFAAGRERGWANAVKFARIAGEFESAEPGDPSGLLDHLALMRAHAIREPEAPMVAEGADAVRLMTIHAAKGLEFPVVAVADLGGSVRGGPRDAGALKAVLEAGRVLMGIRLPTPWAKEAHQCTTSYRLVDDIETAAALEEEKRLLYVACTRAEKALIVSGLADPSSEPEGGTRLGWLRSAMGIGAGAESGVLECGTRVVLSVLAPPEGREAIEPPRLETTGITSEALEREPVGLLAETGHVPARVSFSGLQGYRDCPYGYYVRSVLRLGGMRDPKAGAGAMSFGSAFHSALEAGGAAADTPAVLDSAAGDFGLDASGRIRLGAAVGAALRDPLVARALSSGQREVTFAVEVGGVVLDGSIDLMLRENDHALIVDYKTGGGEPDASRIGKYRLQGLCYALAALREGSASATVAFVHPEQSRDADTFKWTATDLPAMEAEIAGILDSMRAGHFEPLGAFEPKVCPECPALGGLCPVSGAPAV